MKELIYISLAIIMAFGCNERDDTAPSRVVITGIDSSKKPGDDFFMYVNSTWYDSAQIPASQSGVGSYSFLNFPQRIRMQGILDSIAGASNQAGSIEQKVGDFYASGMDTTAINKRGFEPIKPLLAAIDSIPDLPSFLKLVARERKMGNGSIIGFSVSPDDKQSTINIAEFSQSGIGLPERDYYFKTDSSTLSIQRAYKKYLSSLFELTGTDADAAEKNAALTYEIEKLLAASHKTNIERRDVKANYNKMAVAALSKKHLTLNWVTLLNELGAKVDSVNVAQPAYYDKLDALLKSLRISDWKTYFKAASLRNYSNYLSQPFADNSFQYAKVLTGQAVKKLRAEEMTQAVDRSLGHALAQLYVKKYFPEDAKKRMRVLVDNLKKAFEARITRLDWM
ncbi:MAG: M13 family peptidase, partial [Chitinophagaceae bacterium]